jgi:glycosyltransferase involved in cell wall biosynthesis
MDEDMFEYIVVDNKSKDDSEKILREFEKEHDNMKVISQKCTMGRGREIAFEQSSYDLIMVIDTDTVYFPIFKNFIDIYLEKYRDFAVQSIYCGIFPRDIWIEIGGRRDLNIYEDLDMWIRIWKLGKMKWYPVFVGENLKEAGSMGSYEYKSKRYSKFDKIKRFIRREYDILRTKEVHRIDLESMYKGNIIDLGLGEMEETWVRNIPRMGFFRYSKVRGREFLRIMRS